MNSSSETALTPALYIVATPIGNLEDMTLRGIRVLRSADTIACEDTRHTRKLLQHFEIDAKSIISYHNFNERACTEKILSLLSAGKSVALVTDAGTPSLSDPGFFLVRAAHEHGYPVVPVPGASALSAAISVCPLPINRFYFEGFLPHKKGRQTRLKFLSSLGCSVVFYESPHRIQKLLSELAEHFGDSRIMLAREMTKLHEEFLVGTISEVREQLESKKTLGEFVVIVEGGNSSSKTESDQEEDANY